MIKKGDKAPDFTLEDAEGRTRSLGEFRGMKLVLYFYPRDDTPGCTKEACGFRDVYARIRAKGAIVVGVSPDSTASHAKFRDKRSLPFILLADPEMKTIQAYGVLGEKTMFGKKFLGVIRSTFLIDEEGLVITVFPKVSPEGHAEEILALF